MAIKEAVVRRIEKKYVVLSLVIAEKCVSCDEKCLLRGRSFRARNKKNLPISVGMVVTVGTSSAAEPFLSVFALIFPVLCAFLGYFFARNASENARAGVSFAALLISTFFTLIAARQVFRWRTPEILEIL